MGYESHGGWRMADGGWRMEGHEILSRSVPCRKTGACGISRFALVAIRHPPSAMSIVALARNSPPLPQSNFCTRCPGALMNNIIYIVGLVVIVIAILSYLGLR
jgi:hypothetical protein